MFGGMLGGMLMGGLLGSLFFGGPFNGISFMDILLLGGGLFLLTRFLRSRQPAPQASGGQGNVHDTDRGAWDHLRSTHHNQAASQADSFPPGFNAEDFLQGAKAAYTRLQASWDDRDLEDLRHFTSPEVFAEIEAQAAADPNPGKTEILLLEARLLEVKTLGNQTVATVLFDAMLREDSTSAPAEQAREAWHFSRYETTGDSHWVVEGIQQLER
jgi:predicted lipid-binding transport protein (Tim44 family)